jgi:flagellar hook assembly protein FlgD
VSYKLNAYAHVTISIISAAGKPVLTLEDRNKAAGSYQVQWNGMTSENIQVPAGMYFYRISATNQNGSNVVNHKMLKIR